MSESHASRYFAAYADRPEWAAIDRAVTDLVGNQDLVETTSHEHIVGYLCEALDRVPKDDVAELRLLWRRRLEKMQATVRDHNAEGRNLVEELIAERRAEAAGE